MNFALIGQNTHWLDELNTFIQNIVQKIPVLDKSFLQFLNYRHPEVANIGLFIRLYFKSTDRQIKTNHVSMLIANLIRDGNLFHKITILSDTNSVEMTEYIYSTGFHFIHQMFPNFFWDPKIRLFLPQNLIDIFIDQLQD